MLALTLALVATPGCGRQIDKVPRIGFLSSVPSSVSDGFREGLKERGLVEGGNIIVEWRWTEGKPERSPELLGSRPAGSDRNHGQEPPCHRCDDTTPIVFIAVATLFVRDVASLARPGGNITGFANWCRKASRQDARNASGGGAGGLVSAS
jgi:putative ABC transport system substrate-binding protein